MQTTYLHESLEGLNSSLAQSDSELLLGKKCPQSGFWGSKILINFWFISHNFRSRYARKSIKGSIDVDFDLVFNLTLSPKNGPLGQRPRPGKDGQNNTKTPLHMTFPPVNLKPKTKNVIFRFQLEDLLNP